MFTDNKAVNRNFTSLEKSQMIAKTLSKNTMILRASILTTVSTKPPGPGPGPGHRALKSAG